MPKKLNLLNKRFGKLVVLEECNKRDNFGNKVYKCLCDCGNITYVRGNSLRTGNNRSCGCLRGSNHGKTHTRLYYVWCSIKQRCYNPNNNRYDDWGGRGVTMCEEWRKDFQAFYNWAINNGYDDNLTIDRIDNNKNYEPDNCRWVDRKTQNRNKRNNRNITIDNETHCLKEWCEILNLKYNTISMRLRRGWDVKRALEVK